MNARLALSVEKAKAENMPKDNIERAVKRGTGEDKDGVEIVEVTYELRTARGELLSGPQRVFAERLYEYDVQGVVSSAAQLQIIMRELQDRLAEQIVNRLASVDPQGPILPEPIDGETLYQP